MLGPGKILPVTAQMGQTSSQPDSLGMTAEGKGEIIETGKSKLERLKGKKGKKKALVANSLQDESAHVSLKLSGDTVYGKGQLSSENDLASLQLQTESFPSFRGSDVPEIHNSRSSNGINSDAQAPEGRKRKRKRHSPETSAGKEDMSPAVAENKRSKHAKVTSHSTPPVSTQGIDAIDTEDEAIASYLREYENGQSIITPFSPSSEDVESPSDMEKLAAKVGRDDSPIPMQSHYQLPSCSGRSPTTNVKDLPMEEQESGSDSDGEGTTSHDLPNGTGQHAFDEEAFGDYVTSLWNSANTDYQAPSYDIPLDPMLTGNDDDPVPAAGLSLAEMDLDFTAIPPSKTKLSKVYSSRRRGSLQENPSTDIYAFPRDDPPELDHEDQEQIMPGIEHIRNHISDTGILLAESERHSSPRPSSEGIMIPEPTPPPLAKRSRPRGNKTQQGGRKTKNHNTPLSQIAQKGGMFTQIEMTKLDALRDAYCEEHGFNSWKFNELIHAPVRGNNDVTELWNSIHELFPYRTRMSVSRFCRRRFHNFSARGVWTQSEDEMLERAVAEKGNSWKAVGTLINRFPEDCRDRYRNYHVNAANRNREYWTEPEVKNLCWAVYDCMRSKREERRRAKEEEYGRDVPESESDSDQEVEEMKLINWQAVSDRMGDAGGARSRLQCSHKWGKLKNAERASYMREVRAVMKASKKSERRKARKDKAHWRLRRATKKLRNMKTGDRHDFLQALSTCGVKDVENIPWKLLGDEHFRARWTTTERKAAWEMFEKEVPGSDTMNYRHVVDQLLAKLVAEDGDRLDERWDPTVDGDINLENKRRKKAKSDRSRYKSKAIVESDAGDQHADEHRNPSEDEEAEKSEGDADKAGKDTEDGKGSDDGTENRDAEQSTAGGQQSGAEEQDSDDSLFNE